MKSSLKAVLSYAAIAANGIVWLSTHVEASPIPLPAWVAPVLSGAAVVAGIVLHYAKPPGLQPSSTEPNDQSQATAQAAGAAGAAASKGPFKK
jgi:hypothetical protein